MLSRIWRRQLTDLTKGQIKARLERSSVTLIDVRRFDEVDAGVIETPQGGKWIHIPLNELEEALELDNDDFAAQFECDQKPDKNDELIFYCMKGVRSASAALYFEQNVSLKINFEKNIRFNLKKGYTNVSNYQGGWWEWNEHWTRDEWTAWSEKANFPLPDHLLNSLDN